MLKEHLSQDHDLASRRFETIDKHVDWIHSAILNEHATKILDLGCGPGLYTNRFAKLGHECVGIDMSPAAIAYAREQARKENACCTYIGHDVYGTDFGSGYGLIMMIYGEFNTFNPMDVYKFFGKAWMSLDEGGILLIEPHTFLALKKMGDSEPSWYAEKEGIFSDKPHMCLQENCWNEANNTLTKRWYVVDALTANVRYIAVLSVIYQTAPRVAAHEAWL